MVLPFTSNSIQTASNPRISKSVRRRREKESLALIITPPPGRPSLSVLWGGKTYSIRILSSFISGLSQLSEQTSISYACVSHFIRSIFGTILWTFRCIILRWLMRVWREISEDELLISAIDLTESGPGLECISPLWMRRSISQRQMTSISKIRKRLRENLAFPFWVEWGVLYICMFHYYVEVLM